MYLFKKVIFISVTLLSFISIGCASKSIVHERGWIGGGYLEANTSFFDKIRKNYFENNSGVVPALPDEVRKQQNGAVLVLKIYNNTPLAKSNIKEGDLIVKVNDTITDNIKAFRKEIDNSSPGSTIQLSIYRNGKIINRSITVGKEKYKKLKSFMVGFGFGTELDIIPNPDFSIFSILSYKDNDNRLELHSPEFNYYKKTDIEKDQSSKEGESSFEGWKLWLVFFGFGRNNEILVQEILENKNEINASGSLEDFRENMETRQKSSGT